MKTLIAQSNENNKFQSPRCSNCDKGSTDMLNYLNMLVEGFDLVGHLD